MKNLTLSERMTLINERRRSQTTSRMAMFKKAYVKKKSLQKNKFGEHTLSEFLTIEQFISLSTSKCTYCGIEGSNIVRSIRKGEEDVFIKINGIDRIDSNLTYTFSNSVSCCKICNIMKNDLTVEEFQEHLIRIHKHLSL